MSQLNSPARERCYETWRRAVGPDIGRAIFDSAFEATKSLALVLLKRQAYEFNKLRRACNYPDGPLLLAALQELIDARLVHEVPGLKVCRYEGVVPPEENVCKTRRVRATDAEWSAMTELLESMRSTDSGV